MKNVRNIPSVVTFLPSLVTKPESFFASGVVGVVGAIAGSGKETGSGNGTSAPR